MRKFMDENFLLSNDTAITLYHDYAKHMPIFDYHCHLSPKEIAENKKYRSITEVWLGGDHYKWRALRSNGVNEKYITGSADDKDKFMAWAKTMPVCIGNPLYHWTHLELKAYFGIEAPLGPDTAEEIWDRCNTLLAGDDFSAKALIKRSNVKVICTTDDPADSLEYHIAIAEDTDFGVKVLPTFRPDKCINIEKADFSAYIKKLAEAANLSIQSVSDLQDALHKRLAFFHQNGCRLSDHALEPPVFIEASLEEVDTIFKKGLQGLPLTAEEIGKYKTHIMLLVGRKYHELGWTMQLHIGTMRNNNTRMLQLLGPDTGFDTIGDDSFAYPLSRLLDGLDKTSELPKTILYSINPRDNELLATLIGCFQDGSIPGKLQFGSGWWFNDQKDGMERQLIALSHLGILGRFVGMLTDSRSFLSYTRHEYFRRILCNLLGEWVENGEFPRDLSLLGKLVQDISYHNAVGYFGIEV